MKRVTQSSKYAIQITVIYLIIGAGWIFFSDRLLGAIISDSQLLIQAQTYKGWFFILVTSLLLFYLIRNSTSSLIRSKEKTQQALEEKQMLLSELHHRVKNNLAVICSLIHLQVGERDDEETIGLLETQYRIYALADIEELLYQNENMSSIPFHEYVEQLSSRIDQSESSGLFFRLQLDELYLDITQAIPLGLLLNEVCTQIRTNNSSRSKDYEVAIDLTYESPDTVSLQLKFERVPSSIFNPLKKEGQIEQTLMKLYTEQLDATADWLKRNGTIVYSLKFKKSEEQQESPLAQMED